MIKIYNYGEVSNTQIFARDNIDAGDADVVTEIIDNVITNGDKALFEYSKRFDRAEYDVDVVIIYDQNTDKRYLAEMVEKTVGENKTVSVQSGDSANIRCKQIIDLRKEG